MFSNSSRNIVKKSIEEISTFHPQLEENSMGDVDRQIPRSKACQRRKCFKGGNNKGMLTQIENQ